MNLSTISVRKRGIWQLNAMNFIPKLVSSKCMGLLFRNKGFTSSEFEERKNIKESLVSFRYCMRRLLRGS
jgi:hypothetical protein